MSARTPGQICRDLQTEITSLGGDFYFAGMVPGGLGGHNKYMFSDHEPITSAERAIGYMEGKLAALKAK